MIKNEVMVRVFQTEIELIRLPISQEETAQLAIKKLSYFKQKLNV